MADRRQDILDAAVRVFADEGYERASIKKIAKAAGVKSSALIYWYFADKAALFNAVITEATPFRELPINDSEFVEQIMALPPEAVLPQIAGRVLAVRDDPTLVRLIRLYAGEAVRSPEAAAVVSQFQKTMVGFLERYLEHQVMLGRLRPHDTVSAARMLIGSMVIYLLGKEIFTPMGETFPPGKDYIASILDVVLHGLEAEHDGDGGSSPTG